MKKSKENDLKIIPGEFKKKRKATNVPRMPRGRLSIQAQKHWKSIMKKIDTSILLPGDSSALALLCDALANYEKTKKALKEKGETYRVISADGVIISRPRPEVETLQIYSELVYSGLREFLLTPHSRSDLGD